MQNLVEDVLDFLFSADESRIIRTQLGPISIRILFDFHEMTLLQMDLKGSENLAKGLSVENI